MSTEQLIIDEFLQDHSEPVMNSTSATAGEPYQIRIDRNHRILNSPVSSDGKTSHVMLIVGVVAVTGVPWMIINMSALPAVGTSPGNGISSTANQSATSDQVAEAQKGERFQIRDTIAGKVDRDALAATLQSLTLSSASTASVGTVPGKHSTGVQRTGISAGELRSPTKLSPTPETRPTTIPGWTLREVTNGTAVLEGPNGVWRVMPGQTVPSVGRVDSIVRWGNRFIIATSSGLISTP
jgi:hypothetical protein